MNTLSHVLGLLMVGSLLLGAVLILIGLAVFAVDTLRGATFWVWGFGSLFVGTIFLILSAITGGDA